MVHVYTLCAIGVVSSQMFLFLVPIDVAFASNISANGVRQAWVTPATVLQWVNWLEAVYYVFLAISAFFLLIALPWTYWYLQDEDETSRPLVNTTLLFFIFLTLVLIGGLVNSPNPANLNLPWLNKLIFMTGFERPLNFVIGILCILGMCYHTAFTVCLR